MLELFAILKKNYQINQNESRCGHEFTGTTSQVASLSVYPAIWIILKSYCIALNWQAAWQWRESVLQKVGATFMQQEILKCRYLFTEKEDLHGIQPLGQDSTKVDKSCCLRWALTGSWFICFLSCFFYSIKKNNNQSNKQNILGKKINLLLQIREIRYVYVPLNFGYTFMFYSSFSVVQLFAKG